MVICANAKKSRELRAEGILNVEKTGIPPATNFEDVSTADHNVLNEEEEPRLHDRYEFVVQDLATQRTQSYSCKNKTAPDMMESVQRFLLPESKPGVIYTDTSLEFTKACEDLSWFHDKSTPASIRNKWNRRKSGQKSGRRNNNSVSSIRIG